MHLLGRLDLRDDFARGFENRCVVTPRAGHDVVAVPLGPKRRARGLRRLTRPDHQVGSLPAELFPSIVELDVEADLDAEFAEVAVEHLDFFPRSRAVLHRVAGRVNREVHLPIDADDLTRPAEEDGGIREPVFRAVVSEVRGDDDVGSELARFLREHILQRSFERDSMREAFPTHGRFRQHRDVQLAAVPLLRFLRHAVDKPA